MAHKECVLDGGGSILEKDNGDGEVFVEEGALHGRCSPWSVLLLLDPTQGEWSKRQQERCRLDTRRLLLEDRACGSGRGKGSPCPLRSLNQSRESLAWGGTCPSHLCSDSMYVPLSSSCSCCRSPRVFWPLPSLSPLPTGSPSPPPGAHHEWCPLPRGWGFPLPSPPATTSSPKLAGVL